MGCVWSSDLPPGLEGPPGLATTKGVKSFDFIGSWGRSSQKQRPPPPDIKLNTFFESDEDFAISPDPEGGDEAHSSAKVGETTKVTVGRDPQGNKIVNQYALIKTLGAGTYGKVKLCVDLIDENFYAIKVCHKGILRRRRIGMSTALQDVVREIAIMKTLDHPNVLHLHEIINDSDHERLYMVLEYMPGGPVCQQGEALEEEVARRYFADVITGLDYLHKQKIIHRDIKPENLLVSENGLVKISDFGVSHVFNGDDDALSSSAGSPAFLAPELCTAGATASGRAVDVWAAGVTLFCMLVGHVPFMAENVIEIYDAIRRSPLVIPPHVSSGPRHLLTRLLERNPKKRLTISEAMEHPWIRHYVGRAFIMQGDRLAPHGMNGEGLSTDDIQHTISNSFQTLNKLKKRMRNLSKQAKLKLARVESPSASSVSWELSEASSEAGRGPSQESVSGGQTSKESREPNSQKGSELLKDIRLVDDDDRLFDDDESDFCRVPSFPEMSSAPLPALDTMDDEDEEERKDESSEEQALGVLEDILILDE